MIEKYVFVYEAYMMKTRNGVAGHLAHMLARHDFGLIPKCVRLHMVLRVTAV